MPDMANITVKAANGTTDVIYSKMTASAGDNVPARWRDNASQSVVGNRSTLMTIARDNQKQNGRAVTSRFKYVVVRNVGGVDTVIGTIPLELHGVLGNQFTQAEIDEAVARGFNLFTSAIVRDTYKEGNSAT